MRKLLTPLWIVALVLATGVMGCPGDEEGGTTGGTDTGTRGDTGREAPDLNTNTDTGGGGGFDFGTTDTNGGGTDTNGGVDFGTFDTGNVGDDTGGGTDTGNVGDDMTADTGTAGDVSSDTSADMGGTGGYCGNGIEEDGEDCDRASLTGGDTSCGGETPVCEFPTFDDDGNPTGGCTCSAATCPIEGDIPSLNAGTQIGTDADGERSWQIESTFDGTWDPEGVTSEEEFVALFTEGDFSPPFFCGGVFDQLTDNTLARVLIPEGADCSDENPCEYGQACVSDLCEDVECASDSPCAAAGAYCTGDVGGVCRIPDPLGDFLWSGGRGTADALYTFTAETAGWHVFSVVGEEDADTLIYVLEACDNSADVLACNDDSPVSLADDWEYQFGSRVYMDLALGESVYVVADAWSLLADDFAFTVTASEVTFLDDGDDCDPASFENEICNEALGLFCLAGDGDTCGELGGAPYLDTADLTVELGVAEAAAGRCGDDAGTFDVVTLTLTGTSDRAIAYVNMRTYLAPFWSPTTFYLPNFAAIPFFPEDLVEPNEAGEFTVTIVECFDPTPLYEDGPSFAEFALTTDEEGGNPLYFQVIDTFVSTDGDNLDGDVTQLAGGWYWTLMDAFGYGFPSNWVREEVIQ